MSCLIRIYTVCHFVFDFFRLIPVFASVDMSIFKDGRVHFRNALMKELITTLSRAVIAAFSDIMLFNLYHSLG